MASHLLPHHSPAGQASAIEFILEGLAVTGRVRKEIRENTLHYRSSG